VLRATAAAPTGALMPGLSRNCPSIQRFAANAIHVGCKPLYLLGGLVDVRARHRAVFDEFQFSAEWRAMSAVDNSRLL
jgi:hypothetical protein